MSGTLIALGSVPKDGGTFTFYRNLRPAIAELGIDIRCVSVGKREAALWEQDYADDGCVLIAPHTHDVKQQALAFARWCERESVDIVMGINSEAILSALPHLSERVRAMSRCANAFDHGYRITMSCAGRLARIVATTPRLRTDLIAGYGAYPGKIELIPNGIAPEPFEAAAAAPRGRKSALRLGFLGRLEHNQKGVFYLPRIVRELNRRSVSFCLQIAGKGRHRSVIEREMRNEIETGQVQFLGALLPNDVPSFLEQTDVFVFTSQFEGCPNSLLEAIMAGCVPVAWQIDGITDFIVDHERTGMICPLGDCVRFAESIERLAADRSSLRTLGGAASVDARDRFSDSRAAAAYAQLFHRIAAEEPPPWRPLPWSTFRPDPNFSHSWRERIPAPIKRWAQGLLAHRIGGAGS